MTGQTYNFTFNTDKGAEPLSLTPVDIAPDRLVSKLYAQGSRLVAVGDTHHPEYAIDQVVNALLESPYSKPHRHLMEYDQKEQHLYEAYASAKSPQDVQAFTNWVKDPIDIHAPDESHPKERQEYFDTLMRTYEIAQSKEHPIDVHFVDAATENVENYNRSIQAKNNVIAYRHQMHKTLETLAKERPDSLSAETEKMQHELQSLKDISEQANSIRDAARDSRMSENIQSILIADNSTALMQMGKDHLDSRGVGRDDTQKNLMERLRERPHLNAVRIDIMAVSPEIIAKLGKTQKFADKDCAVCVGGSEGADYTILIPGKASEYILTEKSSEPVRAEHQKTIDTLEKTKASTISERGIKKMEPEEKGIMRRSSSTVSDMAPVALDKNAPPEERVTISRALYEKLDALGTSDMFARNDGKLDLEVLAGQIGGKRSIEQADFNMVGVIRIDDIREIEKLLQAEGLTSNGNIRYNLPEGKASIDLKSYLVEPASDLEYKKALGTLKEYMSDKAVSASERKDLQTVDERERSGGGSEYAKISEYHKTLGDDAARKKDYELAAQHHAIAGLAGVIDKTLTAPDANQKGPRADLDAPTLELLKNIERLEKPVVYENTRTVTPSSRPLATGNVQWGLAPKPSATAGTAAIHALAETKPEDMPEISTPYLTNGSSGTSVAQLQLFLNARRDTEQPQLPVDGKMQGETHQALLDYQNSKPSITLKGSIGPDTVLELRKDGLYDAVYKLENLRQSDSALDNALKGQDDYNKRKQEAIDKALKDEKISFNHVTTDKQHYVSGAPPSAPAQTPSGPSPDSGIYYT